MCRCTAIRVHPVHTVFSNQADEALSKFFNRLVKRLAWTVVVFSEAVVLCLHNAGQASHEDTPFAGEITENLFFKGGRKQVS